MVRLTTQKPPIPVCLHSGKSGGLHIFSSYLALLRSRQAHSLMQVLQDGSDCVVLHAPDTLTPSLMKNLG